MSDDNKPHPFRSADLGNPTYPYCTCGRQRVALTHSQAALAQAAPPDYVGKGADRAHQAWLDGYEAAQSADGLRTALERLVADADSQNFGTNVREGTDPPIWHGLLGGEVLEQARAALSAEPPPTERCKCPPTTCNDCGNVHRPHTPCESAEPQMDQDWRSTGAAQPEPPALIEGECPTCGHITIRDDALYARLSAEPPATYRVIERLDRPGNRANLDPEPPATALDDAYRRGYRDGVESASGVIRAAAYATPDASDEPPEDWGPGPLGQQMLEKPR